MKDARTPVHLITGFLGSGKTTLLRRLLADPALSDTAVIVNEFGEVGLDHLLVEEVADDVVLLASGCLCCTMRDDLISTLIGLHHRAAAGDIPNFNRVVVETTGLADPIPITEAILVDVQLNRIYRLGRITTAVDGLCGRLTLDTQETAVKQVAAADLLILTKTDLLETGEIRHLQEHLEAMNPSVGVLRATHDAAPGAEIILTTEGIANTLDKTARRLREHAAHSPKHYDGIDTFMVKFGAVESWDIFVDWLGALLWARGDSIFRVKGWIALSTSDRPTIVQGVQHTVFPPEELNYWPESPGRSLLVFIARDLTERAMMNSILDIVANPMKPTMPSGLALPRKSGPLKGG